MKVLGIITEYNPLHNGHIYHIQESKKITESDYVVLVMSGSFTQTGNISTIDKFTKSNIASQYGVDLVIELPTIYSTSSSEYFATGAISLLNSLGIVDCICFGSECNDISVLNNIADTIIKNEDSIWNDIRLEDKNITFAKARNNVLNKYLNEKEIQEINKPNNILGIEYIKALKKINSSITPYLIKRISSDYNESKLNDNEFNFTSATSIRNAIKSNELIKIKKYVPEIIYNNLNDNNILLNENIFKLLRYKIISLSKDELSNIQEVTEGLENRIMKYITISNSYEELVSLLKTKRYIENKIKRVLINILLGIEKKDFENIVKNNITYANILSTSDNGKVLLSEISKKTTIPVITSINDKVILKQNKKVQYLINLDIYSSNIHSLLTNTNLNKDYTKKL